MFGGQEYLGQQRMLHPCLSLHFITLLRTTKNIVSHIVPFLPLTFIFPCFNNNHFHSCAFEIKISACLWISRHSEILLLKKKFWGKYFCLLLWKGGFGGPASLWSLESAGVRIVIHKISSEAMGIVALISLAYVVIDHLRPNLSMKSKSWCTPVLLSSSS